MLAVQSITLNVVSTSRLYLCHYFVTGFTIYIIFIYNSAHIEEIQLFKIQDINTQWRTEGGLGCLTPPPEIPKF